jgi:hypothetical protein
VPIQLLDSEGHILPRPRPELRSIKGCGWKGGRLVEHRQRLSTSAEGWSLGQVIQITEARNDRSGVVPPEDPDIYEIKALSSDNSANRGTGEWLLVIVL